jgi:uncharacterized protein (TIGR02001 family)
MKTKATVAVLCCALLALGAMSAVEAAEASAGVDVASAYVFRGVTFNDGLVAQPYLEVSGLPIDLGVWANFDIDDYDGAANDGQFSEIDLYASYAVPIEAFDLSIGYTEYTYPGSGGDPEVTLGAMGEAEAEGTFGESDREVSVSAGLDVPLAPSVGVYYGLDGGIEDDMYVEASVGHDIEMDEVSLSLGATVGYVNPDADDAEDGFSHYTVSASLSYAMLSAGVTYIGQIDDDVLPDGPGAYDAEVVGTIGIAYDF